MNKERRKRIAEAQKTLGTIAEQIADLISFIEVIRDDEQEYYDNMPESFQSGEKGDFAQQAIDQLETAIDELECLDLDGIGGALDEAAA